MFTSRGVIRQKRCPGKISQEWVHRIDFRNKSKEAYDGELKACQRKQQRIIFNTLYVTQVIFTTMASKELQRNTPPCLALCLMNLPPKHSM